MSFRDKKTVNTRIMVPFMFQMVNITFSPCVFITNRVSTKDTLNPTITSFISYDNGGIWNRLTPPTDMPCTISAPCKFKVHDLNAFFDKNRGTGPFHSKCNKFNSFHL
ncbi:hypothetical protein ACTFIV_008364 [Dictyostelium citrinum]